MFSFLRVTLGTISQGTKHWHKLPKRQSEKQSAGRAWVGQQQLCMCPHAASAGGLRDPGQHSTGQLAEELLLWGYHKLSSSPGSYTSKNSKREWTEYRARAPGADPGKHNTSCILGSGNHLQPPTILLLRGAIASPSSSTFLYKHHIYALYIWPRSSPCNPSEHCSLCRTACSGTATYSNRKKHFHRHCPHSTQFLSPPAVQFLLRDHRGQFFPVWSLVKIVYYFWKQIRGQLCSYKEYLQ